MQLRLFFGSLCFALTIAAAAAPRAAQGQDTAAARPQTTVPSDSLAIFVRAHLAVTKLREIAQAELAEPRFKKDEDQARIRERLRGQIAESLKEHGLTLERYDELTRLVSTDDALRKAFEEEASRQGAKTR